MAINNNERAHLPRWLMRLSNSSFTCLQWGHQLRKARQMSLPRAGFLCYCTSLCLYLCRKSNLNDLSDVRTGLNTATPGENLSQPMKKGENGRSRWSAEFRRSIICPLDGGSGREQKGCGGVRPQSWWARLLMVLGQISLPPPDCSH